MKSCAGCGALSADDVRFCSSCGRAASSDTGHDTPTIGLASGFDAGVPEDPHPAQVGAFAPGTVLARRYRIVALLGHGGMGEVYRAEDLKLGNAVALKFLAPALQGDAVALAHLHDEVRNARQVSHPNVCRVYDIGEVDGQHFLTMEYVDGEDLAKLLRRIGRLPADKALETSQQICAGLAAAHEAGLLHRDLKPANIMLDGRGRVRVTDFGLALTTEKSVSRKTTAGTPPYMAPEQIANGEVSVRSDIYSLGLVLYEIFTGRLPYRTPSSSSNAGLPVDPDAPDSWLRVHQESIPVAPSELVADIDPAVESTILACLQKIPSARPASAEDVAAKLPSIQQARISSQTASSRPSAASASGGTVPPSGLGSVLLLPRSRISIVVTALVAVVALVFFFVLRPGRPPFEHYTIQRAIDSQHVKMTVISPDGLYIASVLRDAAGSESLWVHNVPTNSERAILQDEAMHYEDLVFSPDASSIYFTSPAKGKPPGQDDEFRIAVLGGTPSRVFEGIGAPISFIGKGRVCLYREYLSTDTYKFIDASSDGGDEHVLYTGKAPYPQIPTCSPDGKLAILEDESGTLKTLKFSTGVASTLAPASLGRWFYALQWDTNGKGLFAIAVKKFHYSGQLAYLSYPGGALRDITNDLNDYSGVSVTGDARTIATTQKDRNTHFIDLSLADPNQAPEHHLGNLEWFSWVDPNKLLISGDDSVLKIADLLKDETTTVNVPKDHFFFQPALCGNDALVASGNTLDQKSPGIYRMQLDGSIATRVSEGAQDLWPQCSPDGKQVFYSDDHNDQDPKLMRVNADGSGAHAFGSGVYFRIAPDGKTIAIHDVNKTSRLQLVSGTDLQVTKTMPMPPKASYFVALAADSKSVFYFNRTSAGTTIWRMPIDGTPPGQIASFPGRVFKYMQPSPDGSRLGLVAQEPQSQVLLLHDDR